MSLQLLTTRTLWDLGFKVSGLGLEAGIYIRVYRACSLRIVENEMARTGHINWSQMKSKAFLHSQYCIGGLSVCLS